MGLRVPPALRHRQFRYLWIGLMISIAGSQMQIWAIFWQIRTITDQPIALGAVGLARILPVIVFSLIGGVVADTMNRRKLLFFTQSVMALAAVALALLTMTQHIQLWQIYLLTAVQAFAIAFDSPARQSLVPNLVPARDLPNAFSMNSIAFQTGSIVGPALSGLVIAYWGQAYIYYFNALSYGAVIVALILIGPVKQQLLNPQKNTDDATQPAPSGLKRLFSGRGVNLAAIQEGIRFILNQPIILATMLMDFFATFFASANTLLPIFAVDVLKVGVLQYGWLSAAQSVGAVSAALVISQMKEIRRQGPVFLWSVVIFGLATVAFGLSKTWQMAFAALVFVGAADSVSTIIRNTIRQLQTPDYIRGRMTSINQIFFMGGPQLGEMEAGLAAQLFGAVFAVISGGIGCIVAVIWITRRWPQLRHYNGDEPVLAGSQAPAD
jgi:MFS family permease